MCLLILVSGSEAPWDVKFKGNFCLGMDIENVRDKASLMEVTMNKNMDAGMSIMLVGGELEC